MLLTLLAAVLLSLWFFRQNFKDGSIWMLATYAVVALVLWNDYQTAAVAEEAIPRIVRDFLMLGMVGFVQSLAVAKRISIVTAVIILFCLFAGAYFLQEMLEEDQAFITNADADQYDVALAEDAELLVQVAGAAGLQALQSTATDRGWTVQQAFRPEQADATDLDDYYTVDVNNVPDAERVLTSIHGVLYFEPNEEVQLKPLVAEPSTLDAAVTGVAGINDPFAGQQWAMRVLNMDDYYQVLRQLKPQKKARIAILDTGIDAEHEDIRANYFSIDRKYDTDPMSHGTHCAGIAAGVTNNSIGIASLAGDGSAPFVEITAIKVLNASGMGTQKTIIAGIIEAADEGVDVISLSLGGPSNASRQKAYSTAVKYAHDQGAIVVAAAGNSNMDAFDYAPANATGMITVAALDENLLRASFSNKVHRLKRGIAAPGVAIYSTTPNSNYKAFSGTSMACPFVAGLLGVMKSLDPQLEVNEAYSILHATGKDVQDGKSTGRVVQPAAAISTLVAGK